MKWNDPKINDAFNEGIKEFSKTEKGTKKYKLLHAQLTYIWKKQKEERNEESNTCNKSGYDSGLQ